MLTQVSAVALAPDIRVNGVVPGPVMKTAYGMTDLEWAQIGDKLPLKRTGSGEDVAPGQQAGVADAVVTG